MPRNPHKDPWHSKRIETIPVGCESYNNRKEQRCVRHLSSTLNEKYMLLLTAESVSKVEATFGISGINESKWWTSRCSIPNIKQVMTISPPSIGNKTYNFGSKGNGDSIGCWTGRGSLMNTCIGSCSRYDRSSHD